MAEPPASFKEIEHTADLGVEITATTLPALFSGAAEALFALMVDPQSIQTRDEIALRASGEEPEELLHAWLCELLAQFNITGFIARSCAVDRLGGGRVEGRIQGEKLDLARHCFRSEIKGVTYHDFRLWQEDGRWCARVIFDV